MKCLMNTQQNCYQMENICKYPNEYERIVDTIQHTLDKNVPLKMMDSNCDECPALKTQIACIIIGDLLDNGIIVKEGDTGAKTPKNKILVEVK